MKESSIKIGDQFDNLKVMDFCYIKNKKFAICQCVCGNVTNRRTFSLLTNSNHNCGCIPLWKINSTGLISKTFFYRIKQGANSRDLQFDITMEYIWSLYLKQNKECALTKLPITFGENGAHDRGTVSLDRIDSSIGYIEGNVWWVHKDINLMKLDFSLEEFISLCSMVAEYNL